jgi:hypothetical protein
MGVVGDKGPDSYGEPWGTAIALCVFGGLAVVICVSAVHAVVVSLRGGGVASHPPEEPPPFA